ncbi:MAG: hypothetical protein IPO92_14760 [Saprospiraceae bacterium]|nr:hypothetical protein [Saprospiraceae bacterium]
MFISFHFDYPKYTTKTIIRFLSTMVYVFIIAGITCAQDVTPPIITSTARDTSFTCGTTPDLIDKLTVWYNNAAGATATDNSGTVTFQANITLAQAITTFNNSLDVLCGNKQKVTVVFTAVDPSGNMSPTTAASFFTTDITGPTINNNVPDVQYNCVVGIRDTLIKWIRNKAGYMASDVCSNTVTWTTFSYVISSGNVIIDPGMQGNIANGPYPMIPDGICNWRMNISFTVIDECGNVSGTPGTTTFTVIDNVPPVFVSPPADITISCSDNIPAPIIVALDYCDRSVTPVLTQTSTQVSDMTLCGHYNYIITRMWTATDECSNAASYMQKITIRDNSGPTFLSRPVVDISCKIYDAHKDSIYLTQIRDNCSNVSTNFTDVIRISGCTTTIDRKYHMSDICGNTTTYDQILNVKQIDDPVITKLASNETYDCKSQEDFNARLGIWVQNMGGSLAKPICGPLKSFAAIKGSYDVNNPNTFPGILPVTLPTQVCPSALNGFLRYVHVDFVYYDTCGNASVTTAIFGVVDQNAPTITNCPTSLNLPADPTSCTAQILIPVPTANDECTEAESPVIRTIISHITSPDPGLPTSLVDTVMMKIGPFNPLIAIPLNDAVLTIKLKNLDIDDVTEYFNIIDEDGNNIGQTPLGSGQCSSVNFNLLLPKSKIDVWIQDGYIDLTFLPNIQPDPVFAINDICSASTIETTITYDIDIVNTIQSDYSLNGANAISINGLDSLSLTLLSGNHLLSFFNTDCAGNTNRCDVSISISDETNPLIVCPLNITSTSSIGQCKDTIALPVNFQVIENCQSDRIYEKVSPGSKEAALISYSFSDAIGGFIARNKQFVFSDIFPIRFANQDVTLDVAFYGDNGDIGEYFQVIGPGGYVLGNTSIGTQASGCALTKSSFIIPKNVFNTWILNGQVTLSAIPNNNVNSEGGGINPCSTIESGLMVDNESYIQAKLTYSDAGFVISSTGSTIFNNVVINQDAQNFDLILNGGKNNITLSTTDNEGNTGQCTFEVFVRDIEKPKARCKNTVITIHPSGLVPHMLLPNDVDNGSTDNCGITKTKFRPALLDCSMVGNDVSVVYIVEDEQGNKDSCTTIVKVKATELKPTFSSGLCINDTLKLFANVPPVTLENTYTFHWDGPGGIEFFTENPFIPNADESFNGTYILKVTGFNGCVSIGSVLVNIKPLTNPVLTPNSPTICEGDDLILTSTNFSGNITYEWYRGIYPNGVLLNKTESSEYVFKPVIINPNNDKEIYFFYVIAVGPTCTSNESALLKVTVLKNPDSSVNNSFLSPCEGDNIVLGTSVTNSNYNYIWTGPSGYMETGQYPRVILNADQSHEGRYNLIIKNGQCVSDTASVVVSIFEKPSTPVITSADIFCQGATFNLIAINSPNAELYQWYKDDVLFKTTSDNFLIVANVQSGLQGLWKVKSLKGNCMSEFSPAKAISVDNLLEIGASNSGPVCAGDSITLQATFVPNAIYTWEGPVANIPSNPNPTILAVPGDYSVTITTPTNCQNNANTTVKVINVPDITALSNNSKPCLESKDSIQFFPSVFPNNNGYTYKWTSANGFMSDNKNPLITNISEKDTGLYTLIVYNNGCPSTPLSTQVSFIITPQKTSLLSDEFYCSGDTIKITALNPITSAEYIWSSPLGQVVTNQSFLIIPNSSVINSGAYNVSVKQNGCISLASEDKYIEIRNKPSQPSIASNSPVCFGDTLSLNSGFISNVSYQWNGPNFTSTAADPVIPDVTKNNEGKYTLQISQNGCTSAVSLPIDVKINDEIKSASFLQTSINVCKSDTNGVEICIVPLDLPLNAKITLFNKTTGKYISDLKNFCVLIRDLSIFNSGANFIYAQITVGLHKRKCYTSHCQCKRCTKYQC